MESGDADQIDRIDLEAHKPENHGIWQR